MRRMLPLACLALIGCQSTRTNLPRGDESYSVMPPANTELSAYLLGPFDVLRITVFREPDLSLDNIVIDASGNILLPLIGSVHAKGRTAEAVGAEIAQRLDARYLRNPQVSVLVISAVSQRVTVEGAVDAPGVYDISGNATLLEALARAHSPSRTARLNEIVVFRMIGGHRTGAVFDLAAIRDGRLADPRIMGGDTIVVGYSWVKGAFRDFLATAPILAIFRPF